MKNILLLGLAPYRDEATVESCYEVISAWLETLNDKDGE